MDDEYSHQVVFGRRKTGYRRSARNALMFGAALGVSGFLASCSSSDWPKTAVVLEVDIPPSVDGWRMTSASDGEATNTGCLLDVDQIEIVASANGKSVLDYGPENAYDDRYVLGGQSGELVDGACPVELWLSVSTKDPVVVQALHGGKVIGTIETAAVSVPYHGERSRSAGSPWLLSG